jgi:tetratricopeptide (TPR) repeat protein
MEERMRSATVHASWMVVGLSVGLLGVGSAGCGGSRTAAWEEDTTGDGAVTAEAQATHDAAVAEGDAAWAERESPERLRAAIDAWTRALEAVPSDWELWQRLGRAQYFLADGTLQFDPALEAETTTMYQTAITSTERSLSEHFPAFREHMRNAERFDDAALALVDATAVPALYWRASALGRWARRDGFATVLAYKDEIRAIMTYCLNNDRHYYNAGPDRYFGAFYAVAPTYAGGDLELSRQHFEYAIGVEPNFYGTHVLFAMEYAVKAQDRELFTTQLNLVINGNPDVLPDVRPEQLVEIRKANDGMARMDELFE